GFRPRSCSSTFCGGVDRSGLTELGRSTHSRREFAPSCGRRAASRSRPAHYAAQVASADVLAGPHGEAVRRAAEDRVLMREIAAALRPIEREMIPDIGPTVDALAQRVGALATTLHR